MAQSYKPGPMNPPMGICRIPARSCGPLGCLDQGDPSVTSLLGDTPGSLGNGDWGMPPLLPQSWSMVSAGEIFHAEDGTPLSAGIAPPEKALPAPSATLDWEDVKNDFVRWEGKISHMYLDTKGLVTVGVGKMLPDAAAAQALGFVRRSGQKAASAAEIETDFKEVSKQVKGKLAAQYKDNTKLDLPDAAIFDLLKSVADGFQADLKENFTGYETYPAAAKRALIDMVYNLGLDGLLKFKNLKAAVEANDWKKAALQCHRKGPSEERNNWTRDQFFAAAK